MPLTQLYTAVAGDTITAARWNNEFGNIYDNMVPLLNTYDIKNVKDDYSAVADGTTDDTSAVTTAVAAAYAGGFDLYWPVGTYLTTASIANFHDVKHRGPGVVKRGSDLFYIEQLTTAHANDIYVATTGLDTNDGLSSLYPVLTVQKSCDIAHHWSPLKFGWTIWLAAGTYAEAANLKSHTSFNDSYLIFRGPSVGTAGTASGATTNAAGYSAGVTEVTLASAGTGTILTGDILYFGNHSCRYTVTVGDASVANGGTVQFTPALITALPASATTITLLGTTQRPPTAIISTFGGAHSGTVGLDLNWQNKVQVRDIKFSGFVGSAGLTGVNADFGCVMWTYNVHIFKCRQGIVGNSCKMYVQGGIIEGNTWTTGSFPSGGGTNGVVAYAGSQCSLSYDGEDVRTGTILEHWLGAGYHGKANTHVVSTWATFQSNSNGVFLYSNSRFDDRTNIFKKNACVYYCIGSYLTSDQALGASDYHMGETYDQTPADEGNGNFQIWQMSQFSSEEGDAAGQDIGGIDVCHQRISSSVQTGVIAATLTRELCTIPAGTLAVSDSFKYYEVFICGATTLSTNTKTVTLRLGGVVVSTLTIPTGTQTWTAHITFWSTSNYTSVVQITEATVATIGTVRSTIAGLDHWVDQALEVWTAIPGAADTATLHEARVIKWG